MNCPHCHVLLTMTERQGVEIDYCPQCRGVWLDRGELDKIIERAGALAPAVIPPPAPPPAGGPPPLPPQGDYRRREYDDDDDHYRQGPPGPGGVPGKKRKKEGFFSDLFDF